MGSFAVGGQVRGLGQGRVGDTGSVKSVGQALHQSMFQVDKPQPPVIKQSSPHQLAGGQRLTAQTTKTR